MAAMLLGLGCARAPDGQTREQAAAKQEGPAIAAKPSASSAALSSAAAITSASPPALAAADAKTTTSAPSAPEATAADIGRVYAKTRYVWIRPEPDASKEWIGYLWTGESVALKHKKPTYGPGCMEWYAIEPRGYVCVDGNRATLDAEDPVYRAVLPYAAKLDSPWPHQYGESLGLEPVNPAPGISPTFPTLPIAVHEPRTGLLRRSTVAYSTEASAEGHDYLLSADYQWLPKASVTPYPVVKFEGVKLGSDVKLPLAFFKHADRPAYTRSASGEFSESPSKFVRLSHVELTGERVELGKDHYLHTRRDDLWVRESDAVVPTPQPLTPWGATVGAVDTTGKAPKGRGTWIEVSINAGWLIAYEGTSPVFTTLISPGRGGAAKPGEDPIPHALTPTGMFPISGKFATATMVAPGEFTHSDVPWTQNFSGPHALHTAYWHDDWGDFKSGGCVNVSPIDGRYLFGFTEPELPPGWHGVRWLPWLGPATAVVIHR